MLALSVLTGHCVLFGINRYRAKDFFPSVLGWYVNWRAWKIVWLRDDRIELQRVKVAVGFHAIRVRTSRTYSPVEATNHRTKIASCLFFVHKSCDYCNQFNGKAKNFSLYDIISAFANATKKKNCFARETKLLNVKPKKRKGLCERVVLVYAWAHIFSLHSMIFEFLVLTLNSRHFILCERARTPASPRKRERMKRREIILTVKDIQIFSNGQSSFHFILFRSPTGNSDHQQYWLWLWLWLWLKKDSTEPNQKEKKNVQTWIKYIRSFHTLENKQRKRSQEKRNDVLLKYKKKNKEKDTARQRQERKNVNDVIVWYTIKYIAFVRTRYANTKIQ